MALYYTCYILLFCLLYLAIVEARNAEACFKNIDEENSGISSELLDPHGFIGDTIDLTCTLKAAENHHITNGTKLLFKAYVNHSLSPVSQTVLISNSTMITIAVNETLKTPASDKLKLMSFYCFIETPDCSENWKVTYLSVDRISPKLRDRHCFTGDMIDLKCTLKAAENHQMPLGTRLVLKAFWNHSMENLLQKLLISNSTMLTVAANEALKTPVSDRQIFMKVECNIETPNCTEIWKTTYLKIDTKPKPVENVTCSVYDWKNMTCVFDLGAYYRNEDDLQVKIFWDWTVFRNYSPCPDQRLDLRKRTVTCYWKSNDGKDSYKGLNYYFNIFVKNKVRNVTVKSEIFTQYNVKPSPVKDVRITTENSTSLTLTWSHSSRKSSLRYTIQRCSEWKPTQCKEFFKVDPSILLMDLTPYTNYTISISVVPINSSGAPVGYCSEPTVIKASTLPDAPARNPKMTPGFFDCITEACDKVNIYFMPLPRSDLHGQFDLVNITFSYKNKTGFSKIVNDPKASSVMVSNVCSQCRIRVEARLKNSVSYSKKNPSYLLMYPRADRPNAAETSLVVEALTSTRVHMTWTPLRDADITNYSLCWCRKAGDNTCQSQLHCKVRRKTSGEFTTTLNGTYRDYRFGISVEKKTLYGDIFSSGILWKNCTYYKYGTPKKMPEVTKHPVNDNKRELFLSWIKYQCDPEYGPVQGYRITYCWKKLKNCTDVDLDPLISNYTITDLQNGEYTYLINGIFLGKNGKQFGPSYNGTIVIVGGDSTVLAPLLNSEGSSNVTTIIIAIVVSFLLVIIIVVIIIYKIRKHGNRLDEEVRSIDLPEVPFTKNTDRRGQTGDSGIGTEANNESSGSTGAGLRNVGEETRLLNGTNNDQSNEISNDINPNLNPSDLVHCDDTADYSEIGSEDSKADLNRSIPEKDCNSSDMDKPASPDWGEDIQEKSGYMSVPSNNTSTDNDVGSYVQHTWETNTSKGDISPPDEQKKLLCNSDMSQPLPSPYV